MNSGRGDLEIAPLTWEHARDICTWRYPAPYDSYDVDATPDDLLQPAVDMHAVLMGGSLIGFRTFGADGQVPGWAYDDRALDTGGGLRPELTGQGLGRTVVAAGLAFGRSRHAPEAFRVTVAKFNARARRVVESLGFAPVAEFRRTIDGRPFVVLVRQERHSPTTEGGA